MKPGSRSDAHSPPAESASSRAALDRASFSVTPALCGTRSTPSCSRRGHTLRTRSRHAVLLGQLEFVDARRQLARRRSAARGSTAFSSSSGISRRARSSASRWPQVYRDWPCASIARPCKRRSAARTVVRECGRPARSVPSFGCRSRSAGHGLARFIVSRAGDRRYRLCPSASHRICCCGAIPVLRNRAGCDSSPVVLVLGQKKNAPRPAKKQFGFQYLPHAT